MDIVNLTTVQETIVPTFVVLEGGGHTLGLLCARSTETIPGWLLVAAAVSTAASASVSSSVVVGHTLMLCGGVAVAQGRVDVAWGLLADGHAEFCWIFASWPCIAARLAAWLFIQSWVARYAAPQFNIVSVYNAMDALLSATAML